MKFIRFRFVIKVNITLILHEVKLKKGTHIGQEMLNHPLLQMYELFKYTAMLTEIIN